MTKYVYAFQEGNKNMRELLGGKGANLAEMTSIGLPVPNGFTVTTEACNLYYDNGEKISEEVEQQIFSKLEELEKRTGKKMGDMENPLLVSVRSGARASMPGMMDTVLNLGLNDEVAVGFAKATDNKRFVYDSYRRFIQMFADVVMGYPKARFERLLDTYKEEKGVSSDIELDADDMYEITSKFKEVYKEISGGIEFPQDPKEQLIEAVKAVFRSWNTDRAKVYRKMNDIPSSWGTAVNVQEMVYGNRGNNCGTGVAFTRNPATGEHKLFGEYLINAQGEDVVAGIRTPEEISKLKEDMPEVYEQFARVADTLEKHYKDMQDMEFTIENGKLYMLQTRNGKRTATAALKIAVDMVNEGMLTREEAILKVEPKQLDQLLHPMFDQDALKKGKVIASGLAASPGAAAGKIYFNAEDIKAHKDEKTILVRLETSPEDIEGMALAQGVLTMRGGMTSHAAVVARGMGRCCVSGCSDLKINEEAKTLTDKEGIETAINNKFSLAGLIFAEKSPRCINLEQAAELALNPIYKSKINFCGVFKDAEINSVIEIASKLCLKFVQLHGKESPEYIKTLHEKCPQLTIIKALGMNESLSHEDLVLFKEYAATADYLLLDSKNPGSGKEFDKSLIPDFINKDKTIISGGIGPSNIASILTLNFCGVDCNSCLESAPGKKDPVLVRKLFNRINEIKE